MTISFTARSICATFLIMASTAVARADDTGLAQSLHDLGRQGGRLCMLSHSHSGSGEGPTKKAAMAAAVRSWFEYTAWEYGTDWARWGKSAGKSVGYTKTQSGWSATVESRPCK